MNIEHHLALLGHEVKDRVSDFTGVVTSVSFDLFGCVQAVVRPRALDDKGNLKDACWFDVSRLERTSTSPLMAVPSFDKFEAKAVPGGHDKPIP